MKKITTPISIFPLINSPPETLLGGVALRAEGVQLSYYDL